MTNPQTYHEVRRRSRRVFLSSLVGSAAGLAWFSALPAQAASILPAPVTSITQERSALGQTIYIYKGQPAAVSTVDWSPTTNRIVSAGATQFVGGSSAQIWDAFTGDHVVASPNENKLVASARWSPNGTRIASGTSGGAMIWDAMSGEPLLTYTGHVAPIVGHVEWSPDGARCASSCFYDKVKPDYTVHVWDAQTGTHLLTYSGHAAVIQGISWSPDGRYLASCSLAYASFPVKDNTVQIWDSHTGALLLTYRGHTQGATAVAWSPDGGQIASAGVDGTVQIWNPSTGQLYLTYRGHLAEVSCVAWSPDGTMMASGSWDNSVHLWKPTSPQTLFYYYNQGADGYVYDVDWSPDGTMLVDCTVPLYTSTKGQALVWRGK